MFRFPARFVFIMGTSIALSINSLLRAGSTRCALLRKAVWRSLQLFLIGVIIVNPNYCQGPCAYIHTSLTLATISLTIHRNVIIKDHGLKCGHMWLCFPFSTCLWLSACCCTHCPSSSTLQYLGTTCGSRVCCSAWPGRT